MNALSRIIENASRGMAPVRPVALADQHVTGGRHDPHRVDERRVGAAANDFIADDVEILGSGGGRGRPVVSVPSSAFFAQHLGQNPEPRDDGRRPVRAETAYGAAADLSVAMHRPTPLAMTV